MKLSQEEAVKRVVKELEKANAKFPLFNSDHEGFAVILEEVDELWGDIKANRKIEARQEAIQVAAMAIKFLMS